MERVGGRELTFFELGVRTLVRGLGNWESLMESFGKSSQLSRERHWRAQNSRESGYCLNIHSGAKKLSACLGPGQNLGHLRVFGALFNTKFKKKKLVLKNIFFLPFLHLSGPHLCSGTAQVQCILPGAREKSTSPTPCFFPFPPFHPLPPCFFPPDRAWVPCVFKFGRG